MTENLSSKVSDLSKKGIRIDLGTIVSILRQKDIAFVKDDIINTLSKDHFQNQFYTPNILANLMADLGRLSSPKSIIDISCGIGNILSYCDYASDIEGIDINKEVIELAKLINPHVSFQVANSLEKLFPKKYDLVFTVFPFGMRIKKDGKIYLSETLFIEISLSLLRKQGVLICTVPISFLYNNVFSEIRKNILNNHNLRLIVNFPSNMLPNMNIRSSLLYIEESKSKDEVYLTNFKSNPNEIIERFESNNGELYIKKDDLKTRWDIDFHDPDFVEIESTLRGKETKTIGEMADVVIGYSPKSEERVEKGEYLIISGRNIRNGFLRITNQDKYINPVDRPSFRRTILKPGDIIISILFDARKIYIYKETDPKAILNSSCALIRSPDNEYILTYLQTFEGQKLFLKQAKRATKGSVISRLSIQDLRNIKIPILPLDNLEKISDRAIEESTPEYLEALRAEIEFLRKELVEQKQINKKQESFFENRIAKIETQKSSNELLNRIKGGESKRLEFKSALRFNLRSQKSDKAIEDSALKTIIAFCNTDGGELLIGVTDEGGILGIHLDKFPNEDKYLLHLRNLIIQRIKPSIVQSVDYEIVELEGQKICRVECKKGREGVWLQSGRGGDSWEFYVRAGPSSTPLSPPEAVSYIKEHFK